MSSSEVAANENVEADTHSSYQIEERDEQAILGLLKDIPLLEDTSADSLRRLAAASEVRTYPAGGSVFERGSQPTGLYFVVDGCVKLVVSGPDYRKRVVELFHKGRMFGEIGVFSSLAFRTWTEATTATTLIHVDQAAFLDVIAIDHALTRRMLVTVTARIQHLIDAIGATSHHSADARIAAYIFELAESDKADTEHEFKVTLPTTKTTIASLLNLSQESLSRALGRMRNTELLHVHGRRLHVRDPRRLRELAGR